METVYADLLFLIDFSMDFLTFFILSRVLKQKIKVIRMCSASAMGGLYSVLSLGIHIDRWLSLIFDLFVCFVMCMTAFLERSPNKFRKMPLYTALYFVISAMLGGIMTAFYSLLNRSTPEIEAGRESLSLWVFGIVALFSGLTTLLGSSLLGTTSRSKFGTLTVKMGTRSITLEGMSDSGNLLKDPIGGKGVIVVDREKASLLVPKLSSGKLTELPLNIKRSVRMIPIRTASGEGLLTAFIPDEVTLSYDGETRKIDVLVALSGNKLEDGCCEALIPAEYFS